LHHDLSFRLKRLRQTTKQFRVSHCDIARHAYRSDVDAVEYIAIL
jgi:hypothetical protein